MGLSFYYQGSMDQLVEKVADVVSEDYDWSFVESRDGNIEVTTKIRMKLLSKLDYDYLKESFEFETGVTFETYEDDVIVKYKEYLVPDSNGIYRYSDGAYINWVRLNGEVISFDTFPSSVVFTSYAEYRMMDWLNRIDGVTVLN